MSIFKESFPDFIKNQINTRQKLISGNVRNVAVKHLNSRSPWIRMSSSVNVNGSADLAKNNVLFNGTSSNTGAGQYKMNEGFGEDRGTYKKGPLGFRPMPGIDNISVKNKGAYGSLREVVVNFKCWDINQLEDLEVLYMRPGYTALIEWGWSNYLVEDKNGAAQLKQMDEYYDILNISSPKTIAEITKELREKIENSQGNYDAMYGKVKNYSWTARPDGGYDCTTTIISVGEVIESLKVNSTNIAFNATAASVGGTVLNDPTLLGDYDRQKLINSYNKNYLAGVLNELYAYASTRRKDKLAEGVSLSLVNPNYPGTPTLEMFAIDNPGGVPALSTEDLTKSILTNNVQAYITLESLCHVLNYSLLNTASTPLLITTSSKDNRGNLSPTTCLWNPLQISVEPSTCIISSPVWEAGVNIKFATSGSSSALQAVIDAENKSGIGLTDADDIAAAKRTVNLCLAETMSSNTDENKVLTALSYFIRFKKGIVPAGGKENRNVKEAKQAIEELQRQYELIRGQAKSVKDLVPTAVQAVGRLRASGDLDEDQWRDKLYWDFSGVKGIRTGLSRAVGIFDVKTKYTNSTSEDTVSARNDNWLSKFEQSSTITFLEALKAFDESYDDIVIRSLKLVGKKDATKADIEVSQDITKQDNVAQAAATSASTQQTITNNKSVIQYISKLKKKFVDKNIADEKGIIGNIYININYLYNKITADSGNSDRQERNEINLYDFLKGTLKDCQAAIGNLNSFEIYVDDERASIIDVNFTGDLADAQNAFKVEVQNSYSIVRNYTLQSQIFPEQSAMISIAAQANQDLLNTDSATLKAYSNNITDRSLKVPDDSKQIFEKNIKNLSDKYEAISKILSKIAEFFASTSIVGSTSPNTSVSSSGEYKNALRDLIQFTRNYFKVPGNGFNVIIPTKLSLTFDGLGGVIIGNLFRISENALPKGYKGDGYGKELGYIVTDISQEVRSGDWTTTIGAQTIILDSPDGEQWDYDKLVIDLTPNTAVNENANRVLTKVSGRRPLSDYEQLYNDSTLVNSSEADKYAQKIINNKSKYQNIEKSTGVPWYVVGLIHYRESGLNFDKHLHNGDSLSGPTVNVPAGRPSTERRRFTFEESAIDALNQNGVSKNNFSTIPSILQTLEGYNGLGYYKQGYQSPYIWSGTNQYVSGKYVRDGVYDPNAKDAQLGVAALLKALQSKNVI